MTKQFGSEEKKTTVIKKKTSQRGFSLKGTNSTFWNELRVKSGLTLKDIEELTGIRACTVSTHFLGRFMPSDSDIRKYCSLFSVDYDEGKLQFQNARTAFLGSQRLDSKGPRKMTARTTERVLERAGCISVIKEEKKNEYDTECIINTLYGHISRNDWEKLRFILRNSEDVDRDDVLDLIYNQVDVEVYLKIEKLI